MASPFTTKLTDKRVLIIGGTSGIGFAVAKLALEAGAYVVVSSSQVANVDATIDRLQKEYPTIAKDHISGFPCDMGDINTLEANLTVVFKSIGHPVDHIAFLAGDSLAIMPPADFTPEFLVKAQQMRLVAPMLIAKFISAPQNASFFNHTSASSLTVTGGINTYKPTKNWGIVAAMGASLEGFARGMSVDLAPVRVNVVSPGAILTERFGKMVGGDEAKLKEAIEFWSKKSLTGEIGRPEDVAEAYIYLMKDRFSVGNVLFSDGGALIK